MTTRQRLTDRLVRELPVPASGARITYDAEMPGFGARVTAGGARAYVLNYRVAGRERRYTIGGAAEWKAAAARVFAGSLKARIRLGHDPLAELQQHRSEPTVSDLCDVFIADYFVRLRPATTKLYRAAIEGTRNSKGIRLHFRHARVAGVTHADLEGYHRVLSRSAPTMANRAAAVLSRMFTLAVRKGWRADNPARGIERNQETKRTRYLSADEIARLTAALAALPDQQAANVFR
ncbi:MAG: integrase family protein, partial [Gemmatimonadota bacterium]|nr:integrase family protein [Gemmatimonadota bacterium]